MIAFTKHNLRFRRPEEDSFDYDLNGKKIIVAVADGITRDSVNGKYPNPSPAKIAADLFVKSFISEAKRKNSIEKSIKNSNNKIAKLNSSLKVDYLANDYWACVGVGGVITNSKLEYGFIADCGVCVFSENGKLKFRTPNEGPNSRGSIDEDIRKKYKTSFTEEKGRKIIRSKYRNNIDEKLSYGAFTGEKSALGFLRTGDFDLSKGDYIVFYSDGFIPIIYSKEFNIAKEFNKLEDFFDSKLDKIDGSEGTIVALRAGKKL